MKAPLAALLLAAAVGAASATACRGGMQDDEPLSPQDSIATAREAAASLAGDVGAQTYTYRELYAGMTRAALEQRAPIDPPSARPSCDADTTRTAPAAQRHCAFDARFRRDGAEAHVEVTYTMDHGVEMARDVTVSRDLPLDVDGLRLARTIASAFERQTSVLDRRDESFERHAAHIRVGATSGARQNFAEVSVEEKHGREQLTVRLSRAAAASGRT